MQPRRKLLGLIVNPRAGLGGRVGLKGSDGEAVQEQAIALGAIPHAMERAEEALACLRSMRAEILILTYPGEMGAAAAQGFDAQIIGSIEAGRTTSADTREAARRMAELGADLLLFAGGDGTARDIYDAVGTGLPVLGIPAGVKIHSSAYAIHPRAAGELAGRFLRGEAVRLKEAEVMDIDEEALRSGAVTARLYGYLKVPFTAQFIQNAKSATLPDEQSSVEEIAASIVDQMARDVLYILGPGTTTRAITSRLGLEKTLIGVDVLLNRKILLRDASENQLLSSLQEHPRARIIVTPIGGQGFLFGRGNQQISPAVIEKVGRGNIIVISTLHKIVSLNGRPLLVDTGDEGMDLLLQGYIPVATGHRNRIIYRVAA